VASSAVIVAFILVPLVEMMTQPTLASLKETLMDRDVVRSIRLSIVTSGSAALIAMVFGTPLAYLLARTQLSRAKRSWKA
jgi:molybdate/tungstate transport system permease protein